MILVGTLVVIESLLLQEYTEENVLEYTPEFQGALTAKGALPRARLVPRNSIVSLRVGISIDAIRPCTRVFDLKYV